MPNLKKVNDEHHDSNARKVDSNGAFLTFFKSLFGAGLLSLPNVLGRVGLLLGIGIYVMVGTGCAFSCYLLLQARDITKQRRKQQGRRHHHYLVTYGDLADILLGSTMATVTRWTIIVLNILFTSGLVIVIIENLSQWAGEWHGDDPQAYRGWVGLGLLPLVMFLLQLPWLQDMWLISVLGLAVYTAGVIGSTLFSALWTLLLVDNDDTIINVDAPTSRGVPDNLWTVNWQGIPSFVGSAVYALEGINLALPTAHSMQTESDATRVVCSGIVWYAAVTVVFAAVGYAGGLGGGAGTGFTPDECDVVTNCITPPFLKRTIELALSIAMILSIPVMLYPSTEMLEVLLTDLQQDQIASVEEIEPLGVVEVDSLQSQSDSSITTSTYGSTTCHGHTTTNQEDEPAQSFSHKKSWKLRVFLALLTVTMGVVTKSFTSFSGVVGAVGLSFAGFVLPPLLYLRAMEQANLPLSSLPMKVGMILSVMFGIYNMLVGGASSFMDLWHSFS